MSKRPIQVKALNRLRRLARKTATEGIITKRVEGVLHQFSQALVPDKYPRSFTPEGYPIFGYHTAPIIYG